MAWIESHDELPTHPKTAKLARRIGTSKPAAVGHLHFLWWWCITHRPDGWLRDMDGDDIADAAGWEGDADVFVEGLSAAGWLDFDAEVGDYFVHDWHANRRRNRHNWIPYGTKLDLWVRDGWGCANCDARCGDLQVDHVIPHSRGGSDRIVNLQWLCGYCNRAKSDLLPDEWALIARRVAEASPCREDSCEHDPDATQQRIVGGAA